MLYFDQTFGLVLKLIADQVELNRHVKWGCSTYQVFTSKVIKVQNRNSNETLAGRSDLILYCSDVFFCKVLSLKTLRRHVKW